MLSGDIAFTFIAIVFPLVEILGIITAVHAVMNVRTGRKNVA